MAQSKHPAEAWKLVEFLNRTDSEIAVWKTSGAAPAQLDALASAEVTAPDPYFSNQAAISIFKDTVSAGRPNPTIKEWTQVATIVSDSLSEIYIGNADVQQALDGAVEKANQVMGE
jgi:ABC-type glycerol-3-phosphate transport system substrate-binding protein